MGDRLVEQWLSELGLSQYATAFTENAIDWDVLTDLTEHDLESMGIRLGDRKRLLKAIETLLPAAIPAAGSGAAEDIAQSPLEPPAADCHRRAATAAQAERRQLTVMFCDMAGSTALSTRLDPEDMSEVLRTFQHTCAEVIAGFDGFIARYMGDGMLVYFGYPRAHEDDDERAVRTGLGITAAMEPLNESLRRDMDIEVAVRVGIATGLVVVGDIVGDGPSEEKTVVGETPNLAARLQGLARPNTVVIAPATRELLGERFEYEDIGTHRLEGFGGEMRAWQVVRPREAGSAFDPGHIEGLAPLVGRDSEVALVLDRWWQSKEGEGQAVLLSGEPGIGKSRITLTLRERIGSEPHTYVSYQCSSFHRNSALHPVIEHIRRTARFDRKDSDDRKLDKLEAVLDRTVSQFEEVVPLLAELLTISTDGRYPPLEMSPQKQKEAGIAAVVDQIEARAARGPVLVSFQDLHWIDPTSLEFLDLLVERARSIPVMVLVTFRPEFAAPWTGQSHVTFLSLNRLSRNRCVELVEGVTAGKPLPESLVDQIVAKTDGVPLFVEELTKTVLNSGLLGERDGRYVLNGSLPPRAIPSTIQGSLMARLDQLGADKEIAQIGSVVGRQFSHELMAAVTQMPEKSLDGALDRLVESELVFSHGSPPETTYTFKHALVQDAAYESLLFSRRKELHGRIARTIESKFAESARTSPEMLAHHYTEAGETTKAVDYWLKAAESASDRSANVEAVNHLKMGLGLVEALPEGPERKILELKLRIPLGAALITLKGAGSTEVEQVYARALELCAELPESPLHFAALWGWWRLSMNFQTGHERADKLFVLARNLGDPGLLMQAHHCLWATMFMLGNQSGCYRHIVEGLELYDEERHRAHASVYGGHDARVCGHGEAGLALWLLGFPDQALARIRVAEDCARALSHAGSMAHAMDIGVMLHHYLREGDKVRSIAEALVAFGEEKGFPDYVAKGIFFGGWALITRNRAEAGLADLLKGIEMQRAIGTKEDFPVYCDMLAEAYRLGGQGEQALTQLDEGFAVADESGIHYWDAELHRQKGAVLCSLGKDREPEAEACYREALEIARRQKAKSLELRTAVSLVRLWQAQGKTMEAREALSSVYNWFTEGFETIDLVEARAMLASLS